MTCLILGYVRLGLARFSAITRELRLYAEEILPVFDVSYVKKCLFFRNTNIKTLEIYC